MVLLWGSYGETDVIDFGLYAVFLARAVVNFLKLNSFWIGLKCRVADKCVYVSLVLYVVSYCIVFYFYYPCGEWWINAFFCRCRLSRTIRKAPLRNMGYEHHHHHHHLISKHNDNKQVSSNKGRHNQAGNCTYLRLPYTNNNTSIKHQTVNKAYNANIVVVVPLGPVVVVVACLK